MSNVNSNSKKNRINEEIIAPKIRLIGIDGEQIGVVSVKEALVIADEEGEDLVEIAPQAEPPVCRIMNYGKFLFEETKKRQAAKKKQKQIQIKEIKFRPTTEEGDYQVKLRSLIRFLTDGDKVKISLRFRGREMVHQDLGFKLLERIQGDLDEHGVVEQSPKREGRQMLMVLAPKR
ncbi:translation initiation factor IF-3 [Candidatus Nitrosacidococcus sp. I8]|uniref:translation initiation factor IF-3 n=1 Tax=Candidatus Nitrosacidococcus sp. I8 TaxID=2942908 RepID=UPI002227D6EA|nr:translation initiation factor IF-3 [Candidatus Nitrosacidococcus sp. I8]